MKKWYRWQDYVAVAAGLFTAAAVLFTRQEGMSATLMLVLGGLLAVSGIVNLAMPGTPAMEYVQAVLAAALVLSPWLGSYASATGAAWTSWIAGAVAMAVTAAAIRPSTAAHHNMRMSH
ncbi:SPW repeat protein [Pseudarthrobacter sp. NPDC058362]|uniref:SPW repeat domain-containing protein n=1 Tax=Pseudarthrobacter sp. NPDC058362 TaxID=3346458 RepID=UPI003664788D